MPRARAVLAEFAPAKVNLTLHVVGKRADGYHELSSLVVFADVGDRLTLVPGDTLDLAVRGPTADAAGETGDNLVIRAARLLAERVEGLRAGRFTLDKKLPVAAGLGGGSSDAAAALRLLARVNDLSLDDPRLHEAAKLTGADVPVCLDRKPRVMTGIGEILSEPVALPKLPAVLVNPGVAVPTKDVFRGLKLSGERAATGDWQSSGMLFDQLAASRNDLEAPAIALQGVIADVLAALRVSPKCRLARMSGSGATCFALYESARAAAAAAGALREAHPHWWVRATMLGEG